jgi:hypothetical protein
MKEPLSDCDTQSLPPKKLVQNNGTWFGISGNGSARIGPSFGPVQAKMAENARMGP